MTQDSTLRAVHEPPLQHSALSTRRGVSAVVLTRNEERHLADCLASLAWADEILVLDSGSADRTVAIAEAAGARVAVRPFTTFPEQRNAALALAGQTWVFFVDADERATPELGAEVQAAVAGENAYAGYWVPRRNLMLGRWIRHAGWWPDYQPRLLRRDRARFDPAREVHELWQLDGSAGYLASPLTHVNYERLGELLAKQWFYAPFEARAMRRRGLRARPHNFVLQPWREFRRRFFELEGYRDGPAGLGLSLLMAGYVFLTYVRLARLR